MSTPDPQLSVSEALRILKKYSQTQTKICSSPAEKQSLQQALLLITGLSDYENLGVCADNAEQGFAALESYSKALGYQVDLNQNSIDDADSPIYLKFNAQKQFHYHDAYTGSYRGVLVACQSEDDRIAGTYGHLPLDLFM